MFTEKGQVLQFSQKKHPKFKPNKLQNLQIKILIFHKTHLKKNKSSIYEALMRLRNRI